MSLLIRSVFIPLLLVVPLFAETHITGDITGMTFESGGNPFIVEQDVLIPSGNKAVIKEGCVFLFKPFTGLTVHGHLLVEGTQEQPVIFSSINDGEYNSASEQLPNPFDWNGILVTRESGTVTLKNFKLFFSVYGIKSQNPNIVIDNGTFRSNGQFHFTINDKIQFVQDNIPYSYKYDEKNAPDKPAPIGGGTAKSPTSKRTKIVRYSALGVGIAGTVTGVAFGIKTGIHLAEWNANNGKPGWTDREKILKDHNTYLAGTIIGSALGVLGYSIFGISFLF
ncbi:MAG: hypothetical protein JW863_12260 [Chitinispirillaceae bacterium]|nr:hypothetical protein [Chitinispirillaceae bacterium]